MCKTFYCISARTSHNILQISAINGENHFNQFIIPKIPVHPKVREIIGIRTEDKKIYHNDKELKAVNITTGLTFHFYFSKIVIEDKRAVIENNEHFV